MTCRSLSLAIVLALVSGACTAEPAPEVADPVVKASPSAADTAPTDHTIELPKDAFVIWTRAGMPEGAARALGSVDGVRAITTVRAGLRWLPATDGMVIPIEVAYVEPKHWARIVGADRWYGVRRGNGFLSATGAALRRIVEPTYVELDDGAHHLTPAINDRHALGFEALIKGPAPEGWGRDFLLASYRGERSRLRAAIAALVDAPFRLHSAAQTPFLRHADAVEPLMYLKRAFGEFAARPVGGRLDVAPEWHDTNIVERRVPLLGKVTCHRRIVPGLIAALRQIVDEGLSHLIDPAGYAGCYSPRFIGSDPSSSISAHAFGAALDINAPDNPQGSAPTMDPRIVAIMAANGFTWGGRWLLPDGMHFEWATRSRLHSFRGR